MGEFKILEMSKHVLLFSFIACFLFLISFIPINRGDSKFHTEAELEYFKTMTLSPPPPPVDTNLMFPPVSSCLGCHGFDPNMYAGVDSDGNDVNVYDDWRSSMMANSAKDPFWRAKVSHEIFEIPDFEDDIETKCTSCHAPMGHYTAILRGAAHYTMDDLLLDTIGLEGVSCGACHMISEEELGLTNSGELHFDTNRVVFGPYDVPFAAPMISFVGFEPIFSEHIGDAGICAGCHTLITDTFDPADGSPTGDRFVEQATYHEWLNSTYDVEDVSCQDCHMPQIEDSVVISANYLFLEGRSPYGLHDMVGANTFMLQLMKDNKEALEINATDENYDETIAKTLDMLQQQTLDMDLQLMDVFNDTAYINLSLVNKAGHKFPSGYPARRAVVEFLVTNEEGDTLFHTGTFDQDYYVQQEDAPFEPHHAYISSDEQVQIYEIVPVDINLNFSSVLEYGYISLKDNRLTPLGFTTSHPAYDTTQILGAALNDPDFNFQQGIEGSGGDDILFGIGLNDYIGHLDVQAWVHYQSLPPKWMESMFEVSTPEIDSFKVMFDQADHTPVLIGTVALDSVYVEGGFISAKEPALASSIFIYPNPNTNDLFQVDIKDGLQIQAIQVWDAAGRLVYHYKEDLRSIRIPETGIFMVVIQTDQGMLTKKLIRQ